MVQEPARRSASVVEVAGAVTADSTYNTTARPKPKPKASPPPKHDDSDDDDDDDDNENSAWENRSLLGDILDESGDFEYSTDGKLTPRCACAAAYR